MSSNRSSSGRTNEPSKSKRTGLIIGIIIGVVVLIVIIIVVVLLLRRKTAAASSTATSGCKSNANCSGTKPTCNTSTGACHACGSNKDCSTGKVCNTFTGACVDCITSSDCGPGKACRTQTNTCAAPECTTNTNCSGTTPICDGAFCIQCLYNTDCAGGYPNTCNDDNTCCYLSPPTLSGLDATNGAVSNITGSYSVPSPQTLTNAKVIFRISTPDGQLLYITSNSSAPDANGSIKLSEGTLSGFLNVGIPFYPNTLYNVAVKLVYPCGTTAFSAPALAVFTVVSPIEQVQCLTSNNSNMTAIPTTLRIQMNQPSNFTPNARAGFLFSQTTGFHPNMATVVQRNVPVNTSTSCSGGQCGGTYNVSWGNAVHSTNQVWYMIGFFEKGTTGYPSTSDLSIETSFSVST